MDGVGDRRDGIAGGVRREAGDQPPAGEFGARDGMPDTVTGAHSGKAMAELPRSLAGIEQRHGGGIGLLELHLRRVWSFRRQTVDDAVASARPLDQVKLGSAATQAWFSRVSQE